MSLDYAEGDKFYAADVDNIIQANESNAVITGLACTENDTPGMNVKTAAGSCFAGQTYVNKASATVTVVTAADPTNPRIDLVVINNAGTISVVAGTPAATPNPPDVPDNSIVLAWIDVAALDTQIDNADIREKRIFLGPIKNEMVDASAAIAWSKIDKTGASIADLATIDHHLLDGLGDNDHPQYPLKASTESLSGVWTFTGGSLKFDEGIKLYFKESTQDEIEIYNSNRQLIFNCLSSIGEFRFHHQGSSVMEIDNNEVRFQERLETEDINADTDCIRDIGATGYFDTISCGTLSDGNCSIYDEPRDALEVLSLLPDFLKEGAPRGKIDSKNYPLALRGKRRKAKTGPDRESFEPREKGRDVSAILDYMIFAIKDVKEQLDLYGERIANLEAN